MISYEHQHNTQTAAHEASPLFILNDEPGKRTEKNLLDGLKGNFFGGIGRNQTRKIRVFE